MVELNGADCILLLFLYYKHVYVSPHPHVDQTNRVKPSNLTSMYICMASLDIYITLFIHTKCTLTKLQTLHVCSLNLHGQKRNQLQQSLWFENEILFYSKKYRVELACNCFSELWSVLLTKWKCIVLSTTWILLLQS